MFKFQYQNGKKRKSEKKISGLQNGAIKGLQIRKALEISKWGKKIRSRDRDLKSGKEISNRGRD